MLLPSTESHYLASSDVLASREELCVGQWEKGHLKSSLMGLMMTGQGGMAQLAPIEGRIPREVQQAALHSLLSPGSYCPHPSQPLGPTAESHWAVIWLLLLLLLLLFLLLLLL